MSEKHPDRTSEWRKQQEALKAQKPIPIRVEDKTAGKKPTGK